MSRTPPPRNLGHRTHSRFSQRSETIGDDLRRLLHRLSTTAAVNIGRVMTQKTELTRQFTQRDASLAGDCGTLLTLSRRPSVADCWHRSIDLGVSHVFVQLVRRLAVVAVATAVIGAYLLVHPFTGSSATVATGFYLDIGASSSLGYQPTGIPKHNSHRTDTAYANDVVNYLATRGVDLRLRQIGCPGETVESMLLSGDHCYTLPQRQLLTAEQFLQANHDAVGLVTIDLGFNDVRPCLAAAVVDPTCVAMGLANVTRDLTPVLNALKSAAGPNVHFIGIDYGDPFLSKYLQGGVHVTAATQTLQAMSALDTDLIRLYHASKIPVANVAGAFQLDNRTPTMLKGVGVVPLNVARACQLTWDCTGYPFGPDDHPNNAGYRVIASAIEATLPPAWRG